MTEKQFWLCTPRKLQALLRVHIDLQKTSDEEKPKTAYIDQVLL